FDEISSIESFVRERPTDALEQHIERQRLIGMNFLRASPLDVDSAAIKALARSTTVDVRLAPTAAAPVIDSAASRAVIAAQMETDLRNVGYFERKSRFPRATFLSLDEVDRRR